MAEFESMTPAELRRALATPSQRAARGSRDPAPEGLPPRLPTDRELAAQR
jgi:hypothetical protein